MSPLNRIDMAAYAAAVLITNMKIKGGVSLGDSMQFQRYLSNKFLTNDLVDFW
jgi:hypothetical protein